MPHMNLIMLVERRMRPVPAEIEVLQEFGPESIIIDEGKTYVEGVSVYLNGDSEDFRTWLKPFDGVWTSNNPMLGEWKVQHIKDVK